MPGGRYYFTIDDDIVYPRDYVEKMVGCLKKYKNKAAVAVHGAIFPDPIEFYYERVKGYPLRKELERDTFVSLIGSGTLAFHMDSIDLHFLDFFPLVMNDLRFSYLAREQGVPLVCIKRPEGWLQPIECGENTLWERFQRRDDVHTAHVIKYGPWNSGFSRR